MIELLPISTIVPTRNRSIPLARMLYSLAQQSMQPAEMIVVDASTERETERLCQSAIPDLQTEIIYYHATEVGAAAQRNQAVTYASQAAILFCDDDITFESGCLENLWTALQSNSALGGVNAMITNQKYLSPGKVSRWLFHILHGHFELSYAGKCIGPAFNLLPEDCPNLPEVVLVEWLNLGCTLYRREALPQPPFCDRFTGYSMLEDLTLSLIVGKRWKLANVRTARIFHDSQPGDHKSDLAALARMELVNRHYVMTQILERRQPQDYFKLAVLQLFSLAALLRSAKGWKTLPVVLLGKCEAIAQIILSGFFYHRSE